EPPAVSPLRHHLPQVNERGALEPRDIVPAHIAHIAEHRRAVMRDDRRVLNHCAANAVLGIHQLCVTFKPRASFPYLPRLTPVSSYPSRARILTSGRLTTTLICR